MAASDQKRQHKADPRYFFLCSGCGERCGVTRAELGNKSEPKDWLGITLAYWPPLTPDIGAVRVRLCEACLARALSDWIDDGKVPAVKLAGAPKRIDVTQARRLINRAEKRKRK